MQRPISDSAALVFSEAFYRSLAAEPVPTKPWWKGGRRSIRRILAASNGWCRFCFSRVRDGAVFESPPKDDETVATTQQRHTRLIPWAAGLVLLLVLAFSPIGNRFWGASGQVLALEQVFATTAEGVDGRIERVEIKPDGSMRVFFTFSNQSAVDQELGFDFAETYLADEFGNPYEVIRASAPLEARALVETVSAGESRQIWVDVQAPKDGAA